jgi:hypothetical protein
MKFIAILSILIASNVVSAETNAELAQRGCIPRLDATGNISGYDCNVAQETNGKMKMQQIGKPRKVQMKNSSEIKMQQNAKDNFEISSASQKGQTIIDSTVRFCFRKNGNKI